MNGIKKISLYNFNLKQNIIITRSYTFTNIRSKQQSLYT